MDVCPTEEMPELNNQTDCNVQNYLVLGISSHKMHNLMRSLVLDRLQPKAIDNKALAVSEMISKTLISNSPTGKRRTMQNSWDS